MVKVLHVASGLSGVKTVQRAGSGSFTASHSFVPITSKSKRASHSGMVTSRSYQKEIPFKVNDRTNAQLRIKYISAELYDL